MSPITAGAPALTSNEWTLWSLPQPAPAPRGPAFERQEDALVVLRGVLGVDDGAADQQAQDVAAHDVEAVSQGDVPDRLGPGDPVDPIHEIVEIDEPEPEKRRCGEGSNGRDRGYRRVAMQVDQPAEVG